MGGEESLHPSSDGFASGFEGRRVLHLAPHDKIQSGIVAIPRIELWAGERKEVRHPSGGDKGPKQTNYGLLEGEMNYFPLVAHFFSPDRRLAPRPFLSGRLRIMANLSASVSFRGLSRTNLSLTGTTTSPSSGGKSWIDQLLFIERL